MWHSYEHSVGVVELSNHQASFPPFNFLLTRSLLPPAACSMLSLQRCAKCRSASRGEESTSCPASCLVPGRLPILRADAAASGCLRLRAQRMPAGRCWRRTHSSQLAATAALRHLPRRAHDLHTNRKGTPKFQQKQDERETN